MIDIQRDYGVLEQSIFELKSIVKTKNKFQEPEPEPHSERYTPMPTGLCQYCI